MATPQRRDGRRERVVTTTTSIVTLVSVSCGQCGVVFAMTSEYRDARLNDRRTWYCPNGHPRHFTGRSEADELRDRLAETERQRDFARTSRALYGGPRRTVRILIHDTVQELRAAAERFSQVGGWDRVDGCCHSVGIEEWVRVSRTGVETRRWGAENPDPMALVRLHRAGVTTEIVVHELFHAAAVIYRRDVCRDIRLGDGSASLRREEQLAHILGELTWRTTNILTRRGLCTVA